MSGTLLGSLVALVMGVWFIRENFSRVCYIVKYCLFAGMVYLRRLSNHRNQTSNKGPASHVAAMEKSGYGRKVFTSETEMEQLQPLDKSCPTAVDAVYFNGGNATKDYAVFTNARRHGVKQSFVFIRLHDIGTLERPEHPQTNFKDDSANFEVHNLKLTCVEPLKEWHIEWDGPMRLIPNEGEERTVQVKANIKWRAITKLYDFNTDQSINFLCEVMAGQKWSRKLFQTLQEKHQTHYEQFGIFEGSVEVKGFGSRQIMLHGMRDHSFGKHRDWNDLERYALHYMYLENGTCLAVGCVNMPDCLPGLKIGFVFHPDGRLSPLCRSDFLLPGHGDDGQPPVTMTIRARAEDASEYVIEVRQVAHRPIYMGTETEALVFERFCEYHVNGTLRGWGVSEWQYNRASMKKSNIHVGKI